MSILIIYYIVCRESQEITPVWFSLIWSNFIVYFFVTEIFAMHVLKLSSVDLEELTKRLNHLTFQSTEAPTISGVG